MENVNCLRCHFRHEDNGNCTAVGGFCTAVQAAHCPLLRQYLDTGMTPEAFQSFVVFFQDLIGNQKASEALDRFRQLAKADKDGRLAVLPCKDWLEGVFGDQVLFWGIDKDKLAKLLCLDTLGYSAKDIEIITPEQYEAEFGGNEDG